MGKLSTTLLILAVPAALAACSKDSGIQPVSGKVALASFGDPVTSVRAQRPGAAAIVAPVGSDGSFRVDLPRGKNYRLEFVTASGAPRLIFPRRAGAVEWWFDVRGGGPRFDMGTVRYVGDPTATTLAFVQKAVTSTGTSTGGQTGKDEEVECEDGKDAKTGAVCVDDDDDKEGECHDGKDGDDGECENGKDVKTGQACTDDDEGDDHKTPPPAAAVADKNMPAAIGGCGEDDDDDDEHEGDDEHEDHK